jgi:hypothetical protein
MRANKKTLPVVSRRLHVSLPSVAVGAWSIIGYQTDKRIITTLCFPRAMRFQAGKVKDVSVSEDSERNSFGRIAKVCPSRVVSNRPNDLKLAIE